MPRQLFCLFSIFYYFFCACHTCPHKRTSTFPPRIGYNSLSFIWAVNRWKTNEKYNNMKGVWCPSGPQKCLLQRLELVIRIILDPTTWFNRDDVLKKMLQRKPLFCHAEPHWKIFGKLKKKNMHINWFWETVQEIKI